MINTVEIWSEIHCPWALIVLHRLRQARRERGSTLVLAPRAWPLEWVNGHGTPRQILDVEVAALASQEPELFNRYTGPSWPSTFLPAYELVAAARRVGAETLAEEVDYALRLAFFRDGVDVSIEHGLRSALELAELTGEVHDRVLATWRTANVRADVVAQFETSRTLPIQGSPQIFLPDGRTVHNPGLTDHYWRGGLLRIRSIDPSAPGELIRPWL